MEDDDLIESYLNHTLSEEALQSFEERMETDAQFYDKVRLEKQLFESLQEDGWSFASSSETDQVQEYKTLFEADTAQKLKKTIAQAGLDYKNERKTTRRNWILYSSAAVIAICFGAFSLFNGNDSETDLYAEYINISELPSFVSRGDDNSKKLVEAQQLFEQGSYTETIPILKRTLINVADFQALQYVYLGIAQMELNRFDQAEQTFETLINAKDLIDADQGYWYKALLNLKKGDIDTATAILEKITTEGLSYNQKAAELLLKLEK